MLKILGISTSPREKGNSDLLLRQALEGAQSAGAEVEYLSIRQMKIAPCSECDSCYKTGKCVIQDDYQEIYQKMLDADRIIFAGSIFFMSFGSIAKALIDRCQCLWAAKYILKKLKKSVIPDASSDRRAMVIAVGGSKSTKMFDSIRMTMKYFLDVLEMKYWANLFVNRIDHTGDILRHPEAMKQAHRLGRELALDSPASDQTIEVELT